jgi:hypothetical protein
MYQIAYNPALGNALVGISEQFTDVPEGIVVVQCDGDFPDMSKKYWNTSLLKLDDLNESSRFCTPTEFMRKFTFEERLAIRGLEAAGDLVIRDALELMKGTKEGVNLDDPDVFKTLQYLAYVKQVITADRIEEILR